jgi:alkanesulfonate monooxygenase SsuD/methylene tetrahydromethanopterin reductase-like flavin-dependent oxidoreductase (luciferase family)
LAGVVYPVGLGIGRVCRSICASVGDLLSGGRLDFGIGKGYRHTEFEGFGIPPEEAQARFDEALEVILKAWTTRERFSHEGRFWRFKNVVVEPPPKQLPHPPLWMGAGSPASITHAAERAHNLILDQFASAEMLGERIALFQAETAVRGRRYDPLQVVVARDMFIVDNEREKEAAIRRNNEVHARTLSVSRAPGREGGSHILAYAHTARQQRDSPLMGTPDEILGKLQALSAAGVEYVMLNPAGSRPNLRRFAREVMPYAGAPPNGQREKGSGVELKPNKGEPGDQQTGHANSGLLHSTAHPG